MTRKTLLGALCALAAACGGSSGIDPTKVTFGYPGAAPVAAGSPEASGAGAGEVGVQGAHGLPGESDPTLATASAQSIVNMPENVASACMGDATTALAPGLPSAQARFEKRAAGFAGGDVEAAFAGFDDPSCVTVAPGVITYRGCRETTADQGGTSTVTVDGTLTRTVVPGTATATWDVRVGVVASGTGSTMTVQSHLTGSFTLGASTLVGSSRNDTTVTMSMQGMSVRAAVTHLGDYDLQFQADPFCVTGGTLEVRRVWTERPPMADPSEMMDRAVKFTWEGCGIVTVAWGVRS